MVIDIYLVETSQKKTHLHNCVEQIVFTKIQWRHTSHDERIVLMVKTDHSSNRNEESEDMHSSQKFTLVPDFLDT